MDYVFIFVATVFEVSFSVLKKGGVQIFLSIYCMYKSLVFGDEFLVQGLHLKSHQRCLAGPVKFFHTDWINRFFFNLALNTDALWC